MARPIWGGTISFGLVSIPVKVYPAIESHRMSFHELDEKSGRRIRYKRVVEDSGREVAWKNIVRGFEIGKGRFVTLTKEELQAAEPRKTRTVDVEQFVKLEEIDPVSWDQTYYVVPDGPQAERAYTLFREALARSGRVAIGRFVMRTKEYLVCLRPFQSIVALQTMFFPDEVRSASALPGADRASVRGQQKEIAKELALAAQIIDAMSGGWDPSRYQDTYRERVMKLVQKKAKGEEITVVEEPSTTGKVVDLMSALRASLAGGKHVATNGKRKARPAGQRAASARGARTARPPAGTRRSRAGGQHRRAGRRRQS